MPLFDEPWHEQRHFAGHGLALIIALERRLPEVDDFAARGRAVLIDQPERALHHRLRVFPRIGDRRGAGQHLWRRPVVLAQPPKPPHQVGHMGPARTAPRVELVNHHVAQIAEDVAVALAAVVGNQRRIQHVRVGQHQVAAIADPRALGRRCVAVVDTRFNAAACEQLDEIQDPAQLILGQRLGGEDEERTRRRIFQDRVQNRQQVRQRLAGRRPRREHHVLARLGGLERFSLVTVQLRNPTHRQRFFQGLVHCGRKRRVPGVPRRNLARGDDAVVKAGKRQHGQAPSAHVAHMRLKHSVY